MPLIRRLPKRGFTNIFKTEYAVVNLSHLAELDGRRHARGRWSSRGLVRSGKPVKVLGDGEIGKKLNVTANKFSKSARAKIEAAGGSCEELKA